MEESVLSNIADELSEGERERTASGIVVGVDPDGRPVSARDTIGPLELRILLDSTPVERLTDDGLLITAHRLVVIVVNRAGAAVGVVPHRKILRLALSGQKRDAGLYGPPDGPISPSIIRCPFCDHVAAHHYVEPGETRCARCNEVLRPE